MTVSRGFAVGTEVRLNAGDYGTPTVKIEAGPDADGKYIVRFPSGASIKTPGDFLGITATTVNYTRLARYQRTKNGSPAPGGRCHRCNGSIPRGAFRAKCDIGVRGTQTRGRNGHGVFVCDACHDELFGAPVADSTIF